MSDGTQDAAAVESQEAVHGSNIESSLQRLPSNSSDVQNEPKASEEEKMEDEKPSLSN
jgi:hypothetical protein